MARLHTKICSWIESMITCAIIYLRYFHEIMIKSDSSNREKQHHIYWRLASIELEYASMYVQELNVIEHFVVFSRCDDCNGKGQMALIYISARKRWYVHFSSKSTPQFRNELNWFLIGNILVLWFSRIGIKAERHITKFNS